ncbi:hypothetical protein BHM03_00021634 [Ensete ventricosum]|nr:hypothetical protein BHM03_00021634 [Ensete ventricosum]
MGVLIPIIPLNSTSLEVDGSNLHPCSIDSSVEPKIAFRTRNASDQVSFFLSREVNLHAWSVWIRDDVAMLLRIVEARVVAIVGIAWLDGGGRDDSMGSKIAARIPDDRTPEGAL